ncbi:MAG TPA: glycoside hydrolase family 2 TIM barrel-domain containing protein, partial [Verrucomicrobiae bacterium]
HWDMHGFGSLNYHKDGMNPESGLYEHDFTVPKSWSGQRVFLVFEGAMTDTSAKLNGESAGPMHQGSFYRFKYEVTRLVKPGAKNKLEVNVAKHSANESVNRAERLADYWVFGGIYRPVYLEAVPQQFIERVAIDAKADGNFSMDVFLNGVTEATEVEAQIFELGGKAVGKSFRVPVSTGSDRLKAELQTRISSPRQWTAETPNLYRVEVRLKLGRRVVHKVQQRFGFRTMEVREGDGLYVNGSKVVLKGADRHSFWPDSGRCLSEAVHRLDIETMKDMNMNAVRMSHYPPDAEFLDLCDELGLYVLDELAGWHNHYDTEVGTKLVEEMVTRDVNHPCILFWDNGNESGWNTNLDNLFGKFDPQQRHVLHPWAIFGGVNTGHYNLYNQVKMLCESNTIYMPTEFQHGLFDGGAGAGLEDYWNVMGHSKICAGGFIWVLEDDAVKRPDTGVMDTAGNQAPDGIVGPYRQREGSFYAIKEIWSPIQVTRETNGTFTVENHYGFTDASQCKFTWQLREFTWPVGWQRQTSA